MKYNNKKIEVDGIKFDSKKEYERYKVLELLQKIGEIDNLKLQPRLLLSDGTYIFKNGKKKKQRKIEYVADFEYFENGKLIVEDLKSTITAKEKYYNLKKKLLLAEHFGFDVFREVIDFNTKKQIINDYTRS